MSASLRREVSGAIGRLILDRPDKRNAISREMWRAIPDAVARLDRDDNVRAILVQGEGGHFAAGADIAEFDEVYATRASAAAYAAELAAAMDALCACRTPRVAMIRGVCVGAGVAIALCCDLRFCSEEARFAVTPAKLGLAYCFEDTCRLVDCIGAAAARDMLFSGRLVDADNALRIGLVDRVISADALESDTLAYLGVVAANARGSIGVARDFIGRAMAGQRCEDDATRAAYLDLLEAAEFQEGKIAFREKRKPVF